MPADEHIRYVPESAAVDLRVVGWAAIAALVLLAGAIAGFYALYQHAVPIKTIPAPKTFAEPRVVTSDAEIAERKRLAAEQTARLKTWRWADDRHTLVQIPIDRAMQLLVQKGKDAWAPLLPPQAALSSPTAAAQNAVTPGIPAANANPKSQRAQP